MVRKIKSKKHRGTKDPLSLYKQNFEKIKNKIDKPPKNSDDQEVPKKYQVLKLVINKVKKEERRRKIRHQKRNTLTGDTNNKTVPNTVRSKGNRSNYRMQNKSKDLINTADFIDKNIGWYPKNGRPFNPIPTVEQQIDESDQEFQKRVKTVTNAVIYESKFKKKYNVTVQRNEFGNVEKIIKHRDEKAREKKRLKDKERRLKLKMKKNKGKPQEQQPNEDLLLDDIDEREKRLFKREKFSFGDIVHRPPQLETNKLEKMLKQQKMEARNYLFIQNLQKNESEKQNHKEERTNHEATKLDLEEERKAAVLAYRQQKARNRETMQGLG